MTEEERKIVIRAIFAMWEEVSFVREEEKQAFYENLLQSEEDKIAAIFYRYKNELKKRNQMRSSTMVIPSTIYAKLKRILAIKRENIESSKETLEFEVIDEITLELLNFKKQQIYSAADPETPLFQKTAIINAEEPMQEKILIHTLYYLLLKEMEMQKDKTKLRLPQMIQEIYPFNRDFRNKLSSLIMGNWNTLPLEERQKDFERNFRYYITDKENKKRTRTRIYKED